MIPQLNPSQNPNQDHNQDQRFDQRLTAALEAAPAIPVPEGFAARILAQLPTQHPAKLALRRRLSLPEFPALPSPTVGWRVSYAAALIVLTAMLLTASHPEGRTHLGATILEWSLTVEFILLTLWLTLRTLITR